MLKKEYKQLHKDLSKLTHSFQSIYNQLNVILQRTDMDLVIEEQGMQFKFYPPTTKEEYEALSASRDEFIKIILTRLTKTYIASPFGADTIEDQFKDLFAFANLEDPVKFQVKKKYKYKVTDVPKDKDGNVIKAKPLNMDSSYVQNDLKGEHVDGRSIKED